MPFRPVGRRAGAGFGASLCGRRRDGADVAAGLWGDFWERSAMSSELDAFMKGVEARNPAEPEFHQAVHEVVESVLPLLDRHPEFRKARILERIVEPERVIMFRVPWTDDRGDVQVNRGIRVQFNSALGPYKGGLRFHASVNLGVIKFLGFEQTFKNALTTLPMGGGKGGSDFSPKGKSDAEVQRFCQSFITELFRHVGPDTDVPAGDIGVGAREIGFMFGQYKRLVNRFEGWITGKGLNWGGSRIRTEAAGYGTAYFGAEMLKTRGETFEGKTVCVSGYGNLGAYAMQKLNEMGARVVTIADEEGFAYDPDGINGPKWEVVRDLWAVYRQSPKEYADRFKVKWYPGRPWQIKCDVAIPTGAENEISEADAKQLVENGCRCVVEGANMPSTREAIRIFQEAGLLFGPGKAANAGGVAVSGLEMSQNSIRMSWSREEVDEKLRNIMSGIHKACLETAEAYGKPGNYVVGANVAGFHKVATAMMEQGVV
jgi:glutamate dehydrogenase (NADP+)